MRLMLHEVEWYHGNKVLSSLVEKQKQKDFLYFKQYLGGRNLTVPYNHRAVEKNGMISGKNTR